MTPEADEPRRNKGKLLTRFFCFVLFCGKTEAEQASYEVNDYKLPGEYR